MADECPMSRAKALKMGICRHKIQAILKTRVAPVMWMTFQTAAQQRFGRHCKAR